ncbi:N-terminal fungal transcription regulatory domain-containing protein [Trichoderma reesei QM6a]|uniref:N-terminal fungal transcription regulatory domain-containing protein n=1 Tax=Hypocrea jecorina (strain QM6a) TaxID=431241 RepID=G0RQD8_HYPJQ|nr:N-terminal fungal transcription regulatory domain-containing protein [Trichoderma reesei QM6a]EGR46512.1 N-terminal fungal transcription regulatory domain-containing protein [Trichoderma reesei QM6a]
MPPIRACDTCFRQKIQCLRPDPRLPCNWCSHHSLTCTVSRYNARRSKNTEKKLLDRIRQLEQALAERSLPQHLDVAKSPRRLESTPCALHKNAFLGKTKNPSCEDGGVHPHIDIASYLFARNWYHKGFPIVSETGLNWIASRTLSDTTALKEYCLHEESSGILCGSWPTSSGDKPAPAMATSLPDRSLVQAWLASLPGSSFQILFPALDKVLFEETIETAYCDRHPLLHPDVLSARACLWATLAVVALLRKSGRFSSLVSREMCAERAQYFVELYIDHDHSPNDINFVQACFLLHKYRIAIGQYETASYMLSTAHSRVERLNGHLHHPMEHGSNVEPSLLERRRNHLRKLFWLCYTHVQDLVLPSDLRTRSVTQKPDLRDPDRHLGHDVFLQMPGETVDIEIMGSIAWERILSFLPGDPHLGLLKENVYELLYSPSALEIIDSELLVRIRQLDDELEDWRLAIPPVLRPKLSITPVQGILWNHTFSSYLRSVQLQLEYHFLVTFIHTPVRRFGATQGQHTILPEELHSAMHSSIDLSLEASRSTLRLLREPIAMVRQDTFWRATMYPIVAAMPLFLDILIHPHDGRREEDIGLILSASEVVEKLRKQCVSEYENRHIEQTSEFLRELVRHAYGAVVAG